MGWVLVFGSLTWLLSRTRHHSFLRQGCIFWAPIVLSVSVCGGSISGRPAQALISSNVSVVLAHWSSGMSGSLSLQRFGIRCLLWNSRLTGNLTPASCRFLNSQAVRLFIIDVWIGPFFTIICSKSEGGLAILRAGRSRLETVATDRVNVGKEPFWVSTVLCPISLGAWTFSSKIILKNSEN